MIIAFTGFKESGKTSAAKAIQGVHLHFADPVKNIAKICFGWDGNKDDRGRKLLQIIGTDAGRAYNPDIWVNAMKEKIAEAGPGQTIVIDDLRFNNEAELVKGLGGIIILIKRDGYTSDGHASEKGIDRKYVDITINCSGTVEDLQKLVLESIKKSYLDLSLKV
jgi:hypothetical protein